jgi:C1A family cysteine protease
MKTLYFLIMVLKFWSSNPQELLKAIKILKIDRKLEIFVIVIPAFCSIALEFVKFCFPLGSIPEKMFSIHFIRQTALAALLTIISLNGLCQSETKIPLPINNFEEQNVSDKSTPDVGVIVKETNKESLKLPLLKSTNASPNLTPYQPSGWDSKIVISNTTGTTSSTPVIYDNQPVYIDWAVVNNSSTNITASFICNLFIDDVLYGSYNTNGLNSNYYAYMLDIQISKLAAGTHTIKIVTDANNIVLESDETDNQYARSKSITATVCVNVTPYQPSGWDGQIVLSTVPGTNKNAATILDNQIIYLDAAIQNNGTCDITQIFYTKIYIDNVLEATYNTNSLQSGYYTSIIDEPIGPLTAGNHSIKVVLDTNNNINESNESDNTFSITKTISVSVCANVVPYQPTGWDDKIVISTVQGTKTNTSVIYDDQNIYFDWALINNGTCDITQKFYTNLIVDGVQYASYYTDMLNSSYYAYISDISLAPLSAGTHTIRITVDSNNDIKETNESDNSYTRTFLVIKKQIIPDIKVSTNSLTINEPIASSGNIPSYSFYDNSIKNPIKSGNIDNSEFEFNSLGCIIPDSVVVRLKSFQKSTSIISGLPSVIDWSNNDSPVKHQGSCGSCWAFAAISLIENLGNQNDLSEQVLVSCSESGSCSGGDYLSSLKYAQKNGVPPELCFPYSATNGSCVSGCSNPEFKEKITTVSNYLWGLTTVENLKSQLQNGPLVVRMLVPLGNSFNPGYKSGIYNYEGNAIPETQGHAVLLVGYDDSQNCFKAKNSWGTSWGEYGYFRIAYDDVTDDVQFGSYAVNGSGVYTDNLAENFLTITNQGTENLSVTSISDNSDWLTLSGFPTTPFSIIPAGSQAVLLDVNWTLVGSSTKSGVITIKSNDPDSPSLTVQVTAVPKLKTLSVSPLNQTATNAAGSKNFTVTSNSNWTAISDQDWCTVTSSGNGNGTINVIYSQNTDVKERIVKITVSSNGSSQLVTLNQLGISNSGTSLSFGNQSYSGLNIIVPVKAANFSNVSGFQFTIAYDATKLTYNSCSNWQGGTNAGSVQITNLSSIGKITFVYNDIAINVSSGKFFDLIFTPKINTGMTELTWSDSPTIREISDANGKEIICSYENGNISFVIGYTIDGQLSYPNFSNSKFTPLKGISIDLTNGNNLSSNADTDANGNYQFPCVPNGTYSMNPSIGLPWDGVTAMDITAYKKHIGSVEKLSSLQVKSGDVNESGTLTSADLTIIKQRIGAQISSFTVGDWVCDPAAVVVDGNNVINNINALCYGDANGSYLPTSSSTDVSDIFASGSESVIILNEREFQVRFKVNKAITSLSSITLCFSYPSNLLDIKSLQMNTRNEDLYYTVKDGIIWIVFSTLNPLNLQKNDVLFTMTLAFKAGVSMMSLNNSNYLFTGQGEFGDFSDNVMNGVILSYSNLVYTPIDDLLIDGNVSVYPNPAEYYLKIKNAENSQVTLFDIYGRKLISKYCDSNIFELDIRNVISGTYTLTIMKIDKMITRKIMIKK